MCLLRSLLHQANPKMNLQERDAAVVPEILKRTMETLHARVAEIVVPVVRIVTVVPTVAAELVPVGGGRQEGGALRVVMRSDAMRVIVMLSKAVRHVTAMRSKVVRPVTVRFSTVVMCVIARIAVRELTVAMHAAVVTLVLVVML